MVIGIILGEYVVVEGERPLMDEELGNAAKSIVDEKEKVKEESGNINQSKTLTKMSESSESEEDGIMVYTVEASTTEE